jgi:hypothetical protein
MLASPGIVVPAAGEVSPDGLGKVSWFSRPMASMALVKVIGLSISELTAFGAPAVVVFPAALPFTDAIFAFHDHFITPSQHNGLVATHPRTESTRTEGR